MASSALRVYMGKHAAARIEQQGWTPELFSLVLGASGGPKWLILSHLDRLLFGDFLQRGEHQFSVMGSSIGSWRHACLTTSDPAAAIERFEKAYVLQDYKSKPSPREVSRASFDILKALLGDGGLSALITHPRINSHIVTARGRGLAGSTHSGIMAFAMAGAALGNVFSRRFLQASFQRVVFHSGASSQHQFSMDDFQSRFAALDENNLAAALHASGSIPLVLTGEQNIPGAPLGQYWDGGVIDYHFSLNQYCGDGLMLYPHFSSKVIAGWFDKPLSRRRTALHGLDKLVLLCPSDEFIAELPFGKIPDRSDFTRLKPDERTNYWNTCIERNKALAEEFYALTQQSNPLAGVTLLD